MVHDLEFAQVELRVVDGLKVGNAALKKLHDLLSIDEIEKIMDETREGIEKQKEIDDILSGELTENDETEVEAELDILLAAEVEEKAPEVTEDIILPEVPKELPEKKEGKIFPLSNLNYYSLHINIFNLYFFFLLHSRTEKRKNTRSYCSRSIKSDNYQYFIALKHCAEISVYMYSTLNIRLCVNSCHSKSVIKEMEVTFY